LINFVLTKQKLECNIGYKEINGNPDEERNEWEQLER